MAYYLPKIDSPSSFQRSNARNSTFQSYYGPSKFGFGPGPQAQQQDSLDLLTMKRSPSNLLIPGLNNGTFEVQSNLSGLAEMSPRYPRNNPADPKALIPRNSVFLSNKNTPSPDSQGEQSPGGSNLIHFNVSAPNQARSYSPSVRGPQPHDFSSAMTPRRESTFKKVYDMSIGDSQKLSLYEGMLEKRLEKQNTVLEKIRNQIEAKEEYKGGDLQSPIKPLQQKKMLPDVMSPQARLDIAPIQAGWASDRVSYDKTNERRNSSRLVPLEQISVDLNGNPRKKLVPQVFIDRNHMMLPNSAPGDVLEESPIQFNVTNSNLIRRDSKAGTNVNLRPPMNFGPFIPITPEQLRRKSRTESDTQQVVQKLGLNGTQDFGKVDSDNEKVPNKPKIIAPSQEEKEEEFKDQEGSEAPAPDQKTLVSKMLSALAKKRSKAKAFTQVPQREEEKYEFVAEGRISRTNNATPSRLKELFRKKEVAQNRIRSLLWTVVVLKITYKQKKTWAEVRKNQFEEEIVRKLLPSIQEMKDFIIEVTGKEIEKVINNKHMNLVFVSTKVLPAKKLDKECGALKDFFKTIFSKMTKSISKLPDSFFEFLKSISTDDSLVPNEYLTEFELNRLNFSYFGCLKRVDPDQSKLILSGITVIRVLIYSIIMKPWDAFFSDESFDDEKYDLEKVLNIGSVLYNIVMEMFYDTLPLCQNIQSNKALSQKVVPKKRVLNAISDKALMSKFNVWSNAHRGGEIIHGFYSKMQLSCFFSDRKELVNEIREAVLEWLDALYQKTINAK